MEDLLGECREWRGSRDHGGHGRVSCGGRYIAVHRLCYRLDHLYASTHADNMRDRGLAGNASVFGERNGKAKLTEEDVLEIRRLYDEEGFKQRHVAERFGITQVQVSAIVRRVAWPHVRAPQPGRINPTAF
jgi:predicted XRE-type DNA-binding protein